MLKRTKAETRRSVFLCLFLLGLITAIIAIPYQFGTEAAGGNANGPDRAARRTSDPLVPADFDCSRIKELGIDRQQNLAAARKVIYCGLAEGGVEAEGDGEFDAYGGADVNLITGTETSPNITQSETFTLVNP